MPPTPRDGSRASSAAGLMVLISLALGNFVDDLPLRSQRPRVDAGFGQEGLGLEHVSARMWQDPLFATLTSQHMNAHTARAGADPSEPAAPGIEEKFAELGRELADLVEQQHAVLLLPVTIPGDDYAESHENRLRSRRAVLSALGRCDLFPRDPDHIGFFDHVVRLESSEVRGTETSRVPDAEVRDLHVPFEVFQAEARAADGVEGPRRFDTVIVLWIGADMLGERSLETLAQLLVDLRAGTSASPANKWSGPAHVIGPIHSGQLASWLEQERSLAATPSVLRAELASWTVHSSWATVQFADSPRDPALWSESSLKSGMVLRRTIGSDEDLALAMIDELHLRLVDLVDPHRDEWSSGQLYELEHHANRRKTMSLASKAPRLDFAGLLRGIFRKLGGASDTRSPRLALVAEWDSAYGRSWYPLFQRLIEASICPDCPPVVDGEDVLQTGNCRLVLARSFRYQRGLDGVVQGSGGAFDAGQAAQAIEQPMGRGQVDYLRRLAREIALTGETYEAIGVLGSDVYDKLLVLQALRPLFPEAVFFTTDLDARLLHPDTLNVTRNTVVASHFGLRLHANLQGSLAPFRDSYQTSMFWAALNALGYPEALTHCAYEAPLVFEIGNGRAYQLTGGLELPRTAGEVQARASAPDAQAKSTRHGDRHLGEMRWFAGTRWRAWLPLVLIALLCLLAVPQVTSRIQQFRRWLRAQPRGARRRWIAGIVILLGVGLGAASMLGLVVGGQFDDPGGEPLSFFGGVSIWPSVYLRLAALLVAAVSVVLVLVRVAAIPPKLVDEAVLPPEALTPGLRTDGVAVHFERYMAWGKTRWRLLRAGLGIVVFMTLVMSSFKLLGVSPPYTPGRGMLSFALEKAVLMPAVMLNMLLVMLVIDASFLGSRLLHRLDDGGTASWPVQATAAYAERTGLEPADAAIVLRARTARLFTAGLEGLVYFPASVMFLLMVSRSRSFDNWGWPMMLVIIFCLLGVFLVLCFWNVRFAVGRLRGLALDQLQNRQGESAEQRTRRAEQAASIASLPQGLFSRMLEHPLLRAGLFPIAGMGTGTLLEMLQPFTG